MKGVNVVCLQSPHLWTVLNLLKCLRYSVIMNIQCCIRERGAIQF